MSNSATDRSLLVGMLALQMDFISRDELVGAMECWVSSKETPFEEVLRDRGALDEETCSLIMMLVKKHLAQHDNHPATSLASMHRDAQLEHDLSTVGDLQLTSSLTHVSATDKDDSELAPTYSMLGTATTKGERYRVVRPHARGGLGVVSVAEDEELHREVALKEIQDRYADDLNSRSRFVVEAQITGGLEHPGIVPVYGLGQDSEGRPFYVMRFIRGDSLEAAIRRFHQAGKSDRNQRDHLLELRKLLGHFANACNAVEYAHSRGVIHRDLKPSNIMLGKFGETLVVDWGLAKTVGRGEQHVDSGELTLKLSTEGSSVPTVVGSAIGTPAYMSPEQAEGRLDLIDAKSDVYSLGATLFSLLTGSAPIQGQNVAEILTKAQRADFPKPRTLNEHVPRALEAICLKAMQLQGEDRYPSPRAMVDDIERWLADEPTGALPEPLLARGRRWMRRHPRSIASIVATLLVGAVCSAVAMGIISGKNTELTQTNTELDQTNERLRDAKREVEKQRDNAQNAQREALRLAGEAGQAERLANEQREKAKQEADSAKRARKQAETAREEADRAAQVAREAQGREAEERKKAVAATQVAERALAEEARQRSVAEMEATKARVARKQAEDVSDQLVAANNRLQAALESANAHNQMATYALNLREAQFRIENGDLSLAHRILVEVELWDRGPEWRVLAKQSGLAAAISASGSELVSNPGPRRLSGHSGPVYSVAMSPDGQRLASASQDQTIRIWNRVDGSLERTLRGHTDAVRSIVFLPESQQLASAGFDRSVIVWDLETGQAVHRFESDTVQFLCLVVSPDGRKLFAGGGVPPREIAPARDQAAYLAWRGNVVCWDLNTRNELYQLGEQSGMIRSMALADTGRVLITGAYDGNLISWESGTGMLVREFEGHQHQIFGIGVSPADTTLTTCSGPLVPVTNLMEESSRYVGGFRTWSLADGQELSAVKAGESTIYSVVYSHGGRRILTAGADRTVRIWDVATEQHLITLSGSESDLLSLAMSATDDLIVAGDRDGTLNIWEASLPASVAEFSRDAVAPAEMPADSSDDEAQP